MSKRVTFNVNGAVLKCGSNQIQREIDALRQRIGAFYEQSTPTESDVEDTEEEETLGPGSSRSTSIDPNSATVAPLLHPQPIPSDADKIPHTTHPNSFPTLSNETSTKTDIIIKNENKNEPAHPTYTKPSDYAMRKVPANNANSHFTTKVSNVRLIIKGNTQLDNRTRTATPSTRHPQSIRHHFPHALHSASNKPPPTSSSSNTSSTTTHLSLPSPKPVDDTDMVVCTPKQEKIENTAPSVHTAKKQKLELKRHTRSSPEFVAQLEVEQYMMEETLSELYQLVLEAKKQVVLDLANTSVSLTDFQGRVLAQLKTMESKCRTQQKQHQLALLHPKSESVLLKLEGGATNQLQDSLDLERAKVASLEYTVEELQAKTKDLDALLTERDASLSELLRQLHESGPDTHLQPAGSNSPPLHAPLNRAASDIDPADTDDLPHNACRDLSPQKPTSTPPPVLFPCNQPVDNDSRQESHQQKQPANLPTNHQSDHLQSTLDYMQESVLLQKLELAKADQDQLKLSIAHKDRELKDLQQQLHRSHTTLNEKSQHLDQLRVTQQAQLLSIEITAKDLKLQNDQLRHLLQERDHQQNVLLQQNAQLEQDMKELESHAHNLQMLNQHLQGQEQSLKAQNQTQKTQYQKLQAQQAELRKICYDQDHTIADLTGTMGPLQAQVQELNVKLQQVEQHVQLHPLVVSQKLQAQTASPALQTPQPSHPHEDPLIPLQQPQTNHVPPPLQLPLQLSPKTEIPLDVPAPLPLEPLKSLQPLDVHETTRILNNIQQHAEAVRPRYNAEDVEEVQSVIKELEKIFLETFTEISRLRTILQDEGISPTPLPKC